MGQQRYKLLELPPMSACTALQAFRPRSSLCLQHTDVLETAQGIQSILPPEARATDASTHDDTIVPGPVRCFLATQRPQCSCCARWKQWASIGPSSAVSRAIGIGTAVS